MICLTEKYRPRAFADVAGQDKALTMLGRLPDLTGHAYWLAGPSGTGKTTIARIIAETLADSIATTEIDGGDVSADWLRLVEKSWRIRPLGKGVWAYVVNEAHGMTSGCVRKLLTMLDPVPPYVVWVFTTTTKGQSKLFDGMDTRPLLSRCTLLPMAHGEELYEAVAKRAYYIADKEGLNGRPLENYVNLVKSHEGNLRAVLQAIEAGCMLLEKAGV